MNIVTFAQIDEGLFSSEHNIENFHSGVSQKADIVVLDINTIFEFEENKSEICASKFVSIAIIDDESDYDAFKNFGIDAWIKHEDVNQIQNLINLIEKKVLS
ncbi:MAG: hypothetical protein KGV43_01495 [Arcobacter sp.]|nr:hypothetical protein [Arcobacter sp.]